MTQVFFYHGASDRIAAAVPAGPPPVHAIGTTLSYIRSNQNGSEPERILVHIPAPNQIHVAKMVAPCTDAAYVTARIGELAKNADLSKFIL